eukprot:scaffold95578_cov20-Prasinocladus_malaysianus.AAC.1
MRLAPRRNIRKHLVTYPPACRCYYLHGPLVCARIPFNCCCLGGVGQVLGTHDTTAQVHPERLTNKLVERSGARVCIGTVEGLETTETPQGETQVTGGWSHNECNCHDLTVVNAPPNIIP